MTVAQEIWKPPPQKGDDPPAGKPEGRQKTECSLAPNSTTLAAEIATMARPLLSKFKPENIPLEMASLQLCRGGQAVLLKHGHPKDLDQTALDLTLAAFETLRDEFGWNLSEDEFHEDVLTRWQTVKFPVGQSPLAVAIERAQAQDKIEMPEYPGPLPPARFMRDSGITLEVCRILSGNGEKIFFVPTRNLADGLGCDWKRAARILNFLKANGWIQETTSNKRKSPPRFMLADIARTIEPEAPAVADAPPAQSSRLVKPRQKAAQAKPAPVADDKALPEGAKIYFESLKKSMEGSRHAARLKHHEEWAVQIFEYTQTIRTVLQPPVLSIEANRELRDSLGPRVMRGYFPIWILETTAKWEYWGGDLLMFAPNGKWFRVFVDSQLEEVGRKFRQNVRSVLYGETSTLPTTPGPLPPAPVANDDDDDIDDDPGLIIRETEPEDICFDD